MAARLAPLADVGLEYLKLGQPVPTLSGGEAQRLKLAGHLAEARLGASRARPTAASCSSSTSRPRVCTSRTWRSSSAFRKLLAAGHSLLVIEHNLDVIRAADWIIDLGPKAASAAARSCAPARRHEVMRIPASHTGQALAAYEEASRRSHAGRARGRTCAESAVAEPRAAWRGTGRGRDAIVIHKAREHNLKSIDVEIPRDASR